MNLQQIIGGQMLIGGEWRAAATMAPVLDPYSGHEIGSVSQASRSDADDALGHAEAGAREMAKLSGADRAELLERAADLAAARAADLASLVVDEQGKTEIEAQREADRVAPLLRLCAGEARRICGETLPLDGSANPDGRGKLGMTLRVPSGVVVAITPFNFPLLLVAHKLGPALAAGNAVILKPASATPFSGLALASLLAEAGFPEQAIQCVTGAGATVGPALCSDERVRVVTFTGGRDAGNALTRVAGAKRLLLELGANCPVVVLPDADLAAAVANLAVGGYANAGQVCISVQRAIVSREVYGEFAERLGQRVSALRAGDPRRSDSDIGPVISEAEAVRIEGVIADARRSGARIAVGGDRDGAVVQPAVVMDVTPGTSLFDDELFGPAIALTPVDGLEDALRLVNYADWGLGAAIFTHSLPDALAFARDAHAGNVHINNSPLWRADGMPYGGLGKSGIGKEGPHYAVAEMTESKTVVFH